MTLGTAGHSLFSDNSNENVQSTDSSERRVLGDMDKNYFKKVKYFLVEKGRPYIDLTAAELILSNQNNDLYSEFPKGAIRRYDEKGTALEPILFSAKTSQGQLNNQELHLSNEVSVKVGHSELNSDQMDIYQNGAQVIAVGNVKTKSLDVKTRDEISVQSQKAMFRPNQEYFEYYEKVNGIIKRKRQYEESLTFKTDFLSFSAPESVMNLKGSVAFNKGNLDIYANNGLVFLENYNKRLKYYALSDDVRLQEKLTMGGRPVLRRAFAEKLEGIVSERKIVLTGLPKVFQERDVIKGNRIVIRENIETVEVDDANTNITLERDKEE